VPLTRPLIYGSLIAALTAGAASADTLREALVSAYETNPTLTAQRQTLKGTDAAVAAAKAQGRPQVSADVGLNRTLTSSGVMIV
jgi:outer membrane protein